MCVGVSVCLVWSGIRVAGWNLLFYFSSYVLNMFRTLIYPPSGAWDFSVELPHWSYCSWFDVCWSFGAVWLEWYPCSRLEACNTHITPNKPHRNSNTHRTKNNTTNVVIQQNSLKLLRVDILMSETCWAHKKRNKIASDIKLVFYSSTITMMRGPINTRSVVVWRAHFWSVSRALKSKDKNQIFKLNLGHEMMSNA